uniref:Uncharacterized protein n=1 Tax=mine drainage metagenome TaxID=410659 RepID=E6QPA1_9ZZZZ
MLAPRDGSPRGVTPLFVHALGNLASLGCAIFAFIAAFVIVITPSRSFGFGRMLGYVIPMMLVADGAWYSWHAIAGIPPRPSPAMIVLLGGLLAAIVAVVTTYIDAQVQQRKKEERVCSGCGCTATTACLVAGDRPTDPIRGCSWVQGSTYCTACIFPEIKIADSVERPAPVSLFDRRRLT